MDQLEKDFWEMIQAAADEVEKIFVGINEMVDTFFEFTEEMTEQLENALADRFERDDAVIVQEIEQMTDKNAVMVERINNLAHGEQEYVFD